MKQVVIREYQKGSLSLKELQADIQATWDTLKNDSKARAELERQGMTDQIDFSGESPFVVEEKGQGLTPAEVLIAVAVHAASAGTYDALKAIWLKWIAPRIKARVDDALGPPSDS